LWTQRLIPTVFSSLYHYGEETGVHVSATCSHDKLLREADDMVASAAWQEIDAECSKWAAMLPKERSNLLYWLIEQSDDVMANLFAFFVAATIDSVAGTEAAHPVNTLVDLLRRRYDQVLDADAGELSEPRIEGANCRSRIDSSFFRSRRAARWDDVVRRNSVNPESMYQKECPVRVD
jgi:hypothetical protein